MDDTHVIEKKKLTSTWPCCLDFMQQDEDGRQMRQVTYSENQLLSCFSFLTKWFCTHPATGKDSWWRIGGGCGEAVLLGLLVDVLLTNRSHGFLVSLTPWHSKRQVSLELFLYTHKGPRCSSKRVEPLSPLSMFTTGMNLSFFLTPRFANRSNRSIFFSDVPFQSLPLAHRKAGPTSKPTLFSSIETAMGPKDFDLVSKGGVAHPPQDSFFIAPRGNNWIPVYRSS